MQPPSIAVIIPAFNHARTITACLDSIFAQTMQPEEVIVVDDGSTDETVQVLAPYMDRIRYVRQENAGAPVARNHGFQTSISDFVIFCDADVVMKPDMLEKMSAGLLHHPEHSFAYSGFVFGWKAFRGIPFSRERLYSTNYIHTTSLIRRKDFSGFDEQVRRLQDWDLWLTMAKEGLTGICVSEKPLFSVRIDGDSRIGSAWLPKILYQLPWKSIGWTPKRVKKYLEAREALAKKHKEIQPLT